MSSMNRVLDGDVLVNHLTEDERMLDRELLARHGPTGRTLVKAGPLRPTKRGPARGGARDWPGAKPPDTRRHALRPGRGGGSFPHPCRGAFTWRFVPVVALVPRFTTG